MTDATPQRVDSPAAPLPWPRLEPGAVVCGRWIVRGGRHAIGPGVILDGVDRRLGHRRCALVAWPEITAEALAAAWPTTSAPRAPLLDVVPIAGGAVAVVALDDGADRVDQRPDLSREARGRLAVELVDAVARAEDESVPTTQTAVGQLWCTGDARAPRLLIVAVPRMDALGDGLAAHRAGERAVLARRVAGWLYGVPATLSPTDALDRMPDTVRAVLEPLYADAPDERMAASLDRDRFASALGVSEGTRVPVPTGDPSGPAFGATWSSRARAAARRGWRDVVLAAGVVLTVAAALSSLLGGTSEYPSASMSAVLDPPAAPPESVESPTALRPGPPVDLTPAVETWRDRDGTPTWYASVGEGPIPAGVTAVDPSTLQGLRGSHAVFTDEYGRVRRVEDYGPFGRFDGWREVLWADDESTVTILFYDTTGRPLRTRHVDLAAGLVTERRTGGATALDGCASLEVSFDALRRPREERCLNRAGERVPFASGPHRVTYEWHGATSLPTRTAYLDDAGAPMADRNGIAAMEVTWDALGRESVRVFRGVDETPVRHPEIGASHVVTTWRSNAVRTSLFDAEQRPVRGPDGWHVEDVTWTADRVVRRSWLDESQRPVAIRGTDVAAESLVVGDHGELLERRWLGVDGSPVTDGWAGRGTGVHRYTYVRTQHDDVLRECAWGLDGEPVLADTFGGAHCHFLNRDASGRVISEWRVGTDGAITPDPSTGAERTIWTWSGDGVVTRVSWHRADGAPMAARGGAYAIRYAWHPSTGDRLSQTWVDVSGQPVAGPDGHHGVTWRHDERGRVVETCHLGAGVAGDVAGVNEREQCVLTEWDDAGRVHRLEWAPGRPLGPTWADRAVSTTVHSVEFVYVAGRVHQQLWAVGAQEPLVQRCAVDVCVNAAGDGPLGEIR